jgi:GNAT superfamily N-acetyltransferase
MTVEDALTVVPLAPSLAEAAAAVARRAVLDGWPRDFSADYVAACLRDLTAASFLDGRGQRLAALLGGRVVGVGALAGEWIHGVFTDPPHQRRGVGRALLGRLREEARVAGLAQLRLIAAPGAVQFYEAAGFVVSETLERDYGRLVSMVGQPGGSVQ